MLNLSSSLCLSTYNRFRLAGNICGHPAWNKKNQLEKVRRNESKATKMLSEKMGNREIAAVWKLMVWASGA